MSMTFAFTLKFQLGSIRSGKGDGAACGLCERMMRHLPYVQTRGGPSVAVELHQGGTSRQWGSMRVIYARSDGAMSRRKHLFSRHRRPRAVNRPKDTSSVGFQSSEVPSEHRLYLRLVTIRETLDFGTTRGDRGDCIESLACALCPVEPACRVVARPLTPFEIQASGFRQLARLRFELFANAVSNHTATGTVRCAEGN